MVNQDWLNSLDPGIRREVQILSENGIETYESCEGTRGHVYPEPTVRFHGGPGEGFRALGICFTYGLKVYALRRIWQVIDGEPTGPHWELTFRHPGGGGLQYHECPDGRHFWERVEGPPHSPDCQCMMCWTPPSDSG